jgi:hypothetical protein
MLRVLAAMDELLLGEAALLHRESPALGMGGFKT